MMKNNNQHTVANAVRIEIDPANDNTYLVFKVEDEAFKQKVRENWSDDIPVMMIGKSLVEVQ
jgi:hypothetical protein